MNQLTISELAKAAKVNVATIRYYEKRGLIAKPPRTDSGYRIFTSDSISDICKIKYAQSLGFTLEEIKTILTIYKTDHYFPTDVMRQNALTKLEEIEEQMRILQNLKSLLEKVIHISDATLPTPKELCPLMKNLAERSEEHGEEN
ncbi:MerR family mercuric resistance operon transcriptional regulator [Sporosarcina luteola]|nr:MerR family mercuric resistance operon transcriptional regulator [Sporosarcina luteola]